MAAYEDAIATPQARGPLAAQRDPGRGSRRRRQASRAGPTAAQPPARRSAAAPARCRALSVAALCSRCRWPESRSPSGPEHDRPQQHCQRRAQLESRLRPHRPGGDVCGHGHARLLLARDPPRRAARRPAQAFRRDAGNVHRSAHVLDPARPPGRTLAGAWWSRCARGARARTCPSCSARSSPRRCSTSSRWPCWGRSCSPRWICSAAIRTPCWWRRSRPLALLVVVLLAPVVLRHGSAGSRLGRLHTLLGRARRAMTRVRRRVWPCSASPGWALGPPWLSLRPGGCSGCPATSCWSRWASTIRPGFAAAAAVLFAVNITAVLPATPANLGVFQAACAAVLHTGWHVGLGTGVAYGVILQAVEVTTALLMGAPALVKEGVSWREVRMRAMQAAPVKLPARPQHSRSRRSGALDARGG